MRNSANSLVPNKDAEIALLQELCKCGGEGDTGYIVEHAMAHFPILQTPAELDRETPAGKPWWPGRFRFDLSRLGKKGEAQNVKRGLWRITAEGMERITKAGYNGAKDKETTYTQNDDKIATKLTPTKTLINVWMRDTEGNQAHRSLQIRERLFSLSSLSKLPEMQDIYNELRLRIDLGELSRMAGYVYVSDSDDEAMTRADKYQNLTDKLMFVWTTDNIEGSKAEACQQICERILGLLSLAALPETRPVFDELWQVLDFEKLYWMAGSIGITGFWGDDTYLELF